MRTSRLGFVLGGISLGALAAACSSSGSSVSPADAGIAPALEGVYVTTSLGPVLQLYFVDTTHVDVTWAACDDEGDECTTNDTYAVSEGLTELDIVDSNGKTSVLSLSSVVQESADDRLELQGGSLTGGGGVSLSGDASTLTGDGGALTHAGVPLVHSFGVKLATGCVQLFKSSSTFPNDRTAFDFFRSKGLSAVQAAAIVGNFDQESGDNPGAVQPGGPGRGIAQWSTGARWDSLQGDNAASYAHQEGESQSSLQLQLQFSWYELSTFSMYGLSSLRQQTSLNSAVSVFSKYFEACGTCNQSGRDQYAQTAYDTLASDPVAGADAGGLCGGSAGYGSCTASGASGSCISTTTCGTMGGTSSAGQCPGPSSIQCCTGTH